MSKKTNDKNSLTTQKDIYEKIKKQIILATKLNFVYSEKTSNEAINTKVTNQLNSIKTSITRINSKFSQKSKKYEDVNNKIVQVLDEYELSLKALSNIYDKQIGELILKKAELEYKLLMAVICKEYIYQKDKQASNEKNIITHSINHIVEKIKTKVNKKEQVDVSLINKMKDEEDINQEMNEKNQYSEEYKDNQRYISKLESEIKKLKKKISQKNEEKISKIFESMEVGNKEISTEIRKPHTFKNIKKFFVNKFNTYNVIMRNVIEPVYRRIDEFKVNEIGEVSINIEEFNLENIENLLEEKYKNVFNNAENMAICKELGIFEK